MSSRRGCDLLAPRSVVPWCRCIEGAVDEGLVGLEGVVRGAGVGLRVSM